MLLHLWLLLRRLRTVQDATELSQALFDRFCEDMDDNLREMGIGDQTVPKRMRALARPFTAGSRPTIRPLNAAARRWRRRSARIS